MAYEGLEVESQVDVKVGSRFVFNRVSGLMWRTGRESVSGQGSGPN